MGLDKLVRNPKSRPVNLQVVGMDKEAKGSLPYLRIEALLLRRSGQSLL
jgi:hypothetical protein